MIRLVSTRSTGHDVVPVSVGEAIEAGLAPDGGLFIPERLPSVEWSEVRGDSIATMGRSWLESWLSGTEYESVIPSILEDALDFPVPVVPVGEDTWVVELFHGPTLSFKDFGARTMARMLGHRLQQRNDRCVILVATSGDTGSAVADGFSGVPGIDVVLLYPGGGVSEVQERQLIVDRDNVHAFRVEGVFDDCQRLVKGAFSHDGFSTLPLSTANSINIGRLIPQMLYYVWATKQIGRDDITTCVPSGNLGNLTAAMMAHLAGMPSAGFIAAHNANDFFPTYLLDDSASFRPTVATVSNAMDVGAPSNFERLTHMLPGNALSGKVTGDSVSDQETEVAMARVFKETGYLADPHTAVGLEVIRRKRAAGALNGPAMVMSTAHPAKFPDVCQRATGVLPEEPQRLASLATAPKRVVDIPADLDTLFEAASGLIG